MLKQYLGLAAIFLLLNMTMSQASELTEISVSIIGDSVISVYSKKLMRADVEIKNYDPGDGYYFMKITQLSTGEVLNETEIRPTSRGNQLWGMQIAYWLDENQVGISRDDLIGDYEMLIKTEYGSATAKTTFSIVGYIPPENQNPSTQKNENFPSTSSPTSINYQILSLNLQINDGSSFGNVKVFPSLTTSSGRNIPTDVTIYVDGNLKAKVNSNQWSNNIFTGSGNHIIIASVQEMTSPFDNSIKFRLVRDVESYLTSNIIPKVTYYDTKISLSVVDGSSTDYIKVKPELTYGSGSKLSTSLVEIYVNGNYKNKVSSNQWSSNIWAGSGTHTIKASIPELNDPSDSSVRYKASSNTVTFFVTASSGGGAGFSSSATLDVGFPIEYVLIGVIIAGTISVVIVLVKKKKAAPMAMISPAKTPSPSAPQAITQDDTQFWVCPHCGNDTQYKNGKQYCGTCKVYL